MIRRFDASGSRYTPCDMGQEVGYFQDDQGEWHPTRWMVVVTREILLADGTRAQRLRTAYPVAPHKY